MIKENIEVTETAVPKEYEGGPVADLSDAPLPTSKTLRSRRSLIPQFVKFVAFDLTIMRMVLKGHAHD